MAVYDQSFVYKRLCYGRGTARHSCQQKFCNYKTSHLKSIVWHYLQMNGQTDGQTHDDGIYRA